MAHRLITASYEMHSIEEGKEVFIQKTSDDQPFTVYTEMGMALPAFEAQLAQYEAGTDYEFTLSKADAYGEYSEDDVVSLARSVFAPDGVFDEENVRPGAIIPLQDENGERYLGTVVSVDENNVKVDFNHPLAGKDLHFKGRVIENRPASEEEINDFIEKTQQHHCGGHCGGDCGCGDGDCGCGGDGDCNYGDGGCGCGNEGCGCDK